MTPLLRSPSLKSPLVAPRQPMVHVPPGVGILLLVMVVITVVGWLVEVPMQAWLAFYPQRLMGLFMGWNPPLWIQIWTGFSAVTYAFVHGGMGHLALNAAMILIWGTAVERFWRGAVCLITFFVGVIAGAGTGIGYLLLTGDEGIALIGASAGAQALLGAYLWLLMQTGRGRTALIFLIAILATEVFLAFGGVFSQRVAWFAHLGGLGSGILVAVIAGRRPRGRRQAVS